MSSTRSISGVVVLELSVFCFTLTVILHVQVASLMLNLLIFQLMVWNS